MAEEKKGAEHKEKKPAESKKAEHKGKKKHLHQIITTKAHDGSFVHEHVYKAKKEDHHTEPQVFAGTSSNMDDLHQHMDDHFGGGAQEEEAEGEQPAAPGAGEPPAAAGQ